MTKRNGESNQNSVKRAAASSSAKEQYSAEGFIRYLKAKDAKIACLEKTVKDLQVRIHFFHHLNFFSTFYPGFGNVLVFCANVSPSGLVTAMRLFCSRAYTVVHSELQASLAVEKEKTITSVKEVREKHGRILMALRKRMLIMQKSINSTKDGTFSLFALYLHEKHSCTIVRRSTIELLYVASLQPEFVKSVVSLDYNF